MKTRLSLTLVGALLLQGCVQPAEVTAAAAPACMTGWTLCGGSCRSLDVDPANCGACGNSCASDQACVSGSCAPDCSRQLHAPISDPWGYAWDGLERPALVHEDARDACAEIGGRLPTTTELLRVGVAGTAAVGDGYKTNPLWALTPHSSTQSYALALSTPAAANATAVRANTDVLSYRCVCPPPPPSAFAEGACNGPAGEGCFNLPNDRRFNVDAFDRPYLGKSGAIWECAFSKAQLASPERLAASISSGLPNGSYVYLHTSGDDYYTNDTTIRFLDQGWAADLSSNLSGGAMPTRLPFRCLGPAGSDAVPASPSASLHAAPTTRVAIDLADRAASVYTSALVDCFSGGGHLPSGAELASAAMQGAPRAGSDFLWTSDEGGHDGTNWVAMIYKWTGTAYWPGTTGATVPGLGYEYSGWTTWSYKRESGTLDQRPYRCIFYPVDPTYPGPTAAGSCNGGCTTLERTAGRAPGAGVRIWIDKVSRSPDQKFHVAAADCANLGGQLASARDLIEGIRNGLPAPATATTNVLTGDTVAGPVIYTLQWSDAGANNFTDMPGHQIGLGVAAGYRCVWTNEIR